MIQALINNQTTTAFAFTVQFYLNLADKIVGTPTFTTTTIGDDTYYAMSFPYFLIKLKSQQTGKEKLLIPYTMNTTNYERYFNFKIFYTKTEKPVFSPINGFIALNDKDYPFGFYDLQIWQNKEGFTTLDLDNTLQLLYTGVMNVTPLTGSTEVDYSEYTTNDSDTDNVYLTYVKP